MTQHLEHGGTSPASFKISIRRLLIKLLSMSRDAVRFTSVESRRCVQFFTVVYSVSGAGAKEMERAPALCYGALGSERAVEGHTRGHCHFLSTGRVDQLEISCSKNENDNYDQTIWEKYGR